MELTNYTAEGTLHFGPPISQELWDAAVESSRDRELASLPADKTDLSEVYNGKPMFFPKYDHNGLRTVTFYDQGNTVAIVAHLATFIAEWADTSGEPPHKGDPEKVRTFDGRITGTGPNGEPNMWAVEESRIVDLRLSDPDGLLYLIEASGKLHIEWLVRTKEDIPYDSVDLGETVSAMAYELGQWCPGLGGALSFEATLEATHDGVTDEEYEALDNQVAGDPAAKGAWATAIVAKALGLGEAWAAHLADRAEQRRVTGDLGTFAVQAKAITAPDRNEWDDDEADDE